MSALDNWTGGGLAGPGEHAGALVIKSTTRVRRGFGGVVEDLDDELLLAVSAGAARSRRCAGAGSAKMSLDSGSLRRSPGLVVGVVFAGRRVDGSPTTPFAGMSGDAPI